jgi:ATP-dependent DNA helicase RecQ
MSSLSLSSARDVLKKYWGYDEFRNGQEKAISSVLEGKQTLVLFPTGGGKSLCYQVPGMMLDGTTIVISPLVALMQDQVDQLQKLGIRATFINSTLPTYEVEQRLVNARNGMYRMVYIAPERLTTELWKADQERLNISLVAIDEAHCISEWGHDFRPVYRKIRQELEELPEHTRWIALTATATPEVKKDLLEVLQFRNPEIVMNGFRRENLHWWVTHTERKKQVLSNTVMKAAKLGSGIVYSSTRKDCDHLAGYFTRKGINTKAYHAGLAADERKNVQQDWVNGKIPLVTATNAFGMGIDKADCRYVVHYTMPFSLEAYYQEAGRAGRDGEISYPVLIFKKSDEEYLKSRILKNYPEYDVLVQVYNALCDELGLASGSKHEEPESVQNENVAKRSGLPITKIQFAFQLLQRLDVIQTFELMEARVGIHFIVDQDYLMSFIDRAESRKSEFLDILMRQFSPMAFRGVHYVNETVLFEKLGVNARQLKKALRVFSEHDQILTFVWQGNNNLVQVKGSRMKKLHIDPREAYSYRDILLKKLDYMVRYANTKVCREVFLRRYFGEDHCEPCGNCDNCTVNRKKTEDVSETDIRQLKKLLQNEDKTAKKLMSELGWHKTKMKMILSFLQRENIILAVDGDETLYRLRIR